MIAAAKSGSGKTTVTRALMLLLKKEGFSVVPFKSGPDFIDPMYHEQITEIRGHNLDTFFTDDKTTRRLFARDCSDVPCNTPEDKRIAVAEGVMGLYDGLGGFSPEGSSYDLAETLGMPIILCLDARGAAQTLLSVIAGIISFDKKKLIRGIFLNKVSDSFFPVIAQKIEEFTKIPVIGHLPNDGKLQVKSRHLGLFLPQDSDSVGQNRILLEEISKRCDILKLVKIAEMDDIDIRADRNSDAAEETRKRPENRAKIAVARDSAFGFLYRENEFALEDAGAGIEYFSPLIDEKLPDGTSGLILPGGYPENYIDELSENKPMLDSIREAWNLGMPVIAECGGFMYLHDTIGGRGELTGILHGDCFYTGRSVRFGYLEACDKVHFFVKEGSKIRGHEFHYYDVRDTGNGARVRKASSEKAWDEGFADEKHFLGFMHFYYPSCLSFPAHFVDEAVNYGRKIQEQF